MDTELDGVNGPTPAFRASTPELPADVLSQTPKTELYEPLRPDETRLLRMNRRSTSPSSVEAGLQLLSCRVKQVCSSGNGKISKLCIGDDTELRYIALSYAWGDEHDKVTIPIFDSKLGEHLIQVTRTLASAMVQVAGGKDLDCFFWVDQICIDQSSPAEKALQIPLMRQIYEAAGAVFVWLGEDAWDSHYAIPWIREVSRQFRETLYHAVTDRGSSNLWEQSLGPDLAAKAEDIVGRREPETKRRWDFTKLFLRRRWFNRVWIWQEATSVAAEDVQMFCGSNDAFTLGNLREFCATIELIGAFSQEYVSLMDIPHGSIRGMRHFALDRADPPKKTPLLNLLYRLRNSDATDPRDKIFCLLSFATDVTLQASEFDITYETGSRAVFIGFVIWYLRLYRNLDFMGYCQLGRDCSTLPYWTPNWAVRQGMDPFRKMVDTDDLQSDAWFSASGSFTNSLTLPSPLPSEPEILSLEGVRIGTIEHILESDTESWSLDILRSWGRTIKEGLCPLNNISENDVFMRTIIADSTKDRGVPTDKYRTFQSGSLSFEEYSKPQNRSTVKSTTMHRSLFFTRDAQRNSRGLMGLGPGDGQPGDEIWMLKGGKVLYVLRETEPLKHGPYSILDTTGRPSDSMHVTLSDTVRKCVGECFMLGLMDGELLDMMGDKPKRTVCASLAHMGAEFQHLYLR